MLDYFLPIPNALYVSGSPPAAFCLARTGRHHVVGGLQHPYGDYDYITPDTSSAPMKRIMMPLGDGNIREKLDDGSGSRVSDARAS